MKVSVMYVIIVYNFELVINHVTCLYNVVEQNVLIVKCLNSNCDVHAIA